MIKVAEKASQEKPLWAQSAGGGSGGGNRIELEVTLGAHGADEHAVWGGSPRLSRRTGNIISKNHEKYQKKKKKTKITEKRPTRRKKAVKRTGLEKGGIHHRSVRSPA